MKLPQTSLLVLAAAAMGFMGCQTQSSTPLAVAPHAKPTNESPQKPVPKSASVVRSAEGSEVVQATHEASPEPASAVPATSEPIPPATESKPPEPPTVPDSAATRPKADREPTKPGDPVKITFDDLILGMQPDMVFRPFMLTDRAKELDGKRVRLSGDMWPYDASKKVKEFILLRNNKCLYGKGGQADHVADVLMKEGHTIEYTSNTVRIEGTLKIVPVNGDDGNTKHLYLLEDAVAR